LKTLDEILSFESLKTQTLDQKLVRSSSSRLIICGKTFELFEYENPFYYNRGPESQGGFAASWGTSGQRRVDNLRRVQQEVRRIVETNATTTNEVIKFVTYTFAENVTSVPEANRRWRLYCKRFQRRFGRQPYLCVTEFQKRGAVHFHVLYFKLPFVRNLKYILGGPNTSRVSEGLWGEGFVHVKGISHVRSVSAYVSKYITEETHDKRLAGRKAFFCSRGLPRPVEYRNPQAVDFLRATLTMATRLRRSYESAHLGRVHYSQGHIVSP